MQHLADWIIVTPVTLKYSRVVGGFSNISRVQNGFESKAQGVKNKFFAVGNIKKSKTKQNKKPSDMKFLKKI